MNFQIHNLQDGSMKECDLNNLSRSLSVDSEIVLFDGEKVEAIGFVSHSLLVYFCVEFADYALQNSSKKRLPEAKECISLVRKWIENPNSVSKEELNAAGAAAYSSSNASNAAAYAAYIVNAAAFAAADATYAANIFADATNAAAYNAAGVDKEKEFERQGRFILSYFCS